MFFIRKKYYKESAKYLLLANNSKLCIKQSKPENYINKSKILLFESDKIEIIQKKYEKDTENIFFFLMRRR